MTNGNVELRTLGKCECCRADTRLAQEFRKTDPQNRFLKNDPQSVDGPAGSRLWLVNVDELLRASDLVDVRVGRR